MAIAIIGLFGFALGQALIIDMTNAENKINVVRKVGVKNEQ